MEIKFDIDDNKVQHFTTGAKNRLSIQTKKYAEDIVNESEKVEELLREDGASPEITENIVFQAIRRNRTPLKHRKKMVDDYNKNSFRTFVIPFWFDV